MPELVKTLLIACVPAIISGVVSIFVAINQIKTIKEQNKHDLDKLMKQHEIDIENLKEKHSLEMEAKDKDHQHQLELLQKDYDNKMLLLQKEIENAQTVESIKGLFGMMNSTLQSPGGQKLISDTLKKNQNRKQ